MKITSVKINGIVNPIGFALDHIRCSWRVEDFRDKYQKNVMLEVSKTSDFGEITYQKEGRDLSSRGESLEFVPQPCTRYYVRVTVIGQQGETGISEPAFFETAKGEDPWQAKFITTEDTDAFHPVFFKGFSAEKEVSRARLYITGLGLYETYINGKKAGEDYLAPFCNDYDAAVQYQTYDVTELIRPENMLEIWLGNGWYKGRLGFEGNAAFYGDRFCAIAELVVEYSDGTHELIKTDGSWQYRGSDIASSDIYDGEVFDRCLWENRENKPKRVKTAEWVDTQKLVPRYSLPVLAKETLPVQEVLHSPAGETVLDMGQNFAGYLEFHADFPKGTKIRLDFGEVLQQGNFYNDNYRTAKAQFTYVSGGSPELVRPHFTFYGFRYVRVTGWPGTPDKEAFAGKAVYSDLERTGFLKTGDDLVNRLYENCLWGQKSNFLDMPTDCPQRDERLGWTGDAQVFAPTASYNMDTRAFYGKFLKDLRLEQLKWDGSVVNFLPNYQKAPGGSSVWGDAATFIPNTLYEHYRDEEALREQYPLMKDWVDHIRREDDKNGGHRLFDFGFHFGDWLAQDGVTPQSVKGGTDDHYIASVYYYASARMTARAAGVLGRQNEEKEYEALALEIRQAIFREYFTQSGRLSIDTQTAYLIALKFGVYPNKEKLMEAFRKRLEKDCYSIKGGFVGAPMLCMVLAEHGMEKLAYDILLNEEFPGWLYCVKLGATTIWERWNSLLPDGSISGTGMNSLNHYSYGSVIEFLYRQAGGITPEEPGFSKVVFEPKIDSRISYLKARYDSASGTWESAWSVKKDGSITVRFEVPFGCTATAKLPDYEGSPIELEPGSFTMTYMPARDYLVKYDWNTRLKELGRDEAAMAVLKEKLPLAAELANSGDAENLSLSLEKLKYMHFMGFTPEAVEAAASELFLLKRVLAEA